MLNARSLRPWLIWLMVSVMVAVVAFSLWAIGWPLWQEHRALEALAAAFEKESASGYLRAKRNNPTPPGTLVCIMRDPMCDFHRAIDDLKAVRGGSIAVPWLMKRLRREDAVERELAVDALGCIGPAASIAVPELVALLGGERDVGYRTSFALARIGPNAIPALIEVIVSPSPQACDKAFCALREMQEVAAPAVPALRKAYSSPELRSDILRTFASIGPAARAGMPEILSALDDPDAVLRVDAAECAWKVAENVGLALESTFELLEGDNTFAQLAACLLLGDMGPLADAAVPTLTAMLSSEPNDDWDIRREVAETIGRIGVAADGTVEALCRAIAKNEDISQVAFEALGKIAVTSDEAFQALIDALGQEETRFWAIWRLGELGLRAKRAVPMLESVAASEDADIADSARYAIHEIDPHAEPQELTTASR